MRLTKYQSALVGRIATLRQEARGDVITKAMSRGLSSWIQALDPDRPQKPPEHGLRPQKGRDLTGLRAGVWKVVTYVKPGRASPWWWCRCRHCGHERAYRASRLKNSPPGCTKCGRLERRPTANEGRRAYAPRARKKAKP